MAVKWAKVIDQRRCIGCHACTVACKAEHQVPLGVTRTFVKYAEAGTFPSAQRHFQVTRCNQCDDPPCVAACPTSAMYRRSDGIVDFRRDVCIGCKACIAACPYDAIYIDPESHSAEKCNFCTHRVDVGLEPACVVVCPTRAIIVGDMSDATSEVSQLISREKSQVRRPEKHTSPKLFYVQANEATLDPLNAVAQPSYAFAQHQHPSYPLQVATDGPPRRRSRAPYPAQSAAAAILAYHHETTRPFDLAISAYAWTKSISSGFFLIAALGALVGALQQGRAWDVAMAAVSGVFLAVTMLILMGHLSHPERFYLILTRPQWRSWLVRGTFLLLAYGAVLAVFLVVRALGFTGATLALHWAGLVLAGGVALYTAFLLGQSKGRDLWQNPLLPLHFLVQAGLAGAAGLVLLGLFFPITDDEVQWLRLTLAFSAIAHLLPVLSEVLMPHATTEAYQSARNMIWGRWAIWFWGGVLTVIAATVLALVTTTMGAALGVAAGLALFGLFLYKHAYIQAGQSVPLS